MLPDIIKRLRTVKGFVDFNYLYNDEKEEKFHLVNAFSLKGYVDYGYYLIIPLQDGWWKCLRKVITSTKKLES